MQSLSLESSERDTPTRHSSLLRSVFVLFFCCKSSDRERGIHHRGAQCVGVPAISPAILKHMSPQSAMYRESGPVNLRPTHSPSQRSQTTSRSGNISQTKKREGEEGGREAPQDLTITLLWTRSQKQIRRRKNVKVKCRKSPNILDLEVFNSRHWRTYISPPLLFLAAINYLSADTFPPQRR